MLGTTSYVRRQSSLSMKLQTGIVGLPNVGKSTLFNALVGSALAQAANFPFCTIEPNGNLNPNLYPDRTLQGFGSFQLHPDIDI